jgi:pyruvate formate lyase activating enzyme
VAAPFVRPSALQEAIAGKVRCLVCERRCLLVEGGTGWCRTRQNRGGTLQTLAWGAVSSLSANPIEKKPFYHFYPGSRALTVGSWGCNFGCPWCQNWEISRAVPPSRGRFLSPEVFVQETLRQKCQGTSVSFNEPTLSLEWSLEAFRLSRAQGLYNTYVTNGYMTPEALDLLAEAGLDAMNVDVKGGEAAVRKYARGVRADRIWARCRQARQLGLHLEITSLVVPGVNDDETSLAETARRIVEELGPQTPWHLSAYFPSYRFDAPPTPMATLEGAFELGRRAGLEFVYLGNVPGHPHDNTYCPACGALLVERWGFELVRYALATGRCPRCGRTIAGVGWDRAGTAASRSSG